MAWYQPKTNQPHPKMSLWWEENIQSEMLDPESLLRILPYMTKAYSEDKRNADCKHDPITATTIVFLTSPLHLSLTQVGAMLFQGHSALVYPFNLMSERQKAYLRTCLDRQQEWNIYNNAIVFKRRRGEPGKTLSPACVLTSLCKKLLEGKSQPSQRQRLAICNIILQRVQGYVPIDRGVQRHLNEWLSSNVDIKDADRERPAK